MSLGELTWVSEQGAWFGRWVLQRGLGVVYVLAFLVAANQFRPLVGGRGLLPVTDFLDRVRFRQAPSVFHLGYSDRMFGIVAWGGVALSAAATLDLPALGPAWLTPLVWLILWAAYLSIVSVGQIFYGYGWESLTCEAGFLAIFLGPSDVAAPAVVLLLFRWLLLRVELGAGLIKLRGDPCWKQLTCTEYHHETQPLANPLSWLFHQLPRPLHRAEVLANHATQLVVPFGLLLPQPVAGIAAAVMVVTQGWLFLSGNFAWLNLVTMVLGLSVLGEGVLGAVVPAVPPAAAGAVEPAWLWAPAAVVALGVAALSWPVVRNMASPGQAMNASFDPLRLVNTYGAFGSVTRTRYELVVEGTRDADPSGDAAWEAYEFKGKPGDPGRMPPQVAPYHLRLDWQMWFSAMSPRPRRRWFPRFVAALLRADEQVLGLLRHDPFDGAPPSFVRVLRYRYRFTTVAERREVGRWWDRELTGVFLHPVSADQVASA